MGPAAERSVSRGLEEGESSIARRSNVAARKQAEQKAESHPARQGAWAAHLYPSHRFHVTASVCGHIACGLKNCLDYCKLISKDFIIDTICSDHVKAR